MTLHYSIPSTQKLFLAEDRPSPCHPLTSSVYRSQTNIVEHIALLHEAAPGEHCALTLFYGQRHL